MQRRSDPSRYQEDRGRDRWAEEQAREGEDPQKRRQRDQVGPEGKDGSMQWWGEGVLQARDPEERKPRTCRFCQGSSAGVRSRGAPPVLMEAFSPALSNTIPTSHIRGLLSTRSVASMTEELYV